MRKTAGAIYTPGKQKVFMFGGSTMWGTGSKDAHTIPSFLQASLGDKYAVYNYGETGYVSAQELNYLLYLLANGNIPDIVIFYDGVNDGYAGAFSPAIPRDPQNVREHFKHADPGFVGTLFQKSNYGKFVKYLAQQKGNTVWEEKIKNDISANAAGVITMYEAHIKQVEALAKTYGFKAFFFWQPNILSGTKPLVPYEKVIFDRHEGVSFQAQNSVYHDAKKAFSNREKENIFFIGDIFNTTEEGLYIDWCHVAPEGNRIVSDTIYRNIKKAL